MQHNYGQQVKTFFQEYGTQRRHWAALVAGWKEENSNRELRARMEALMAQIEEYHAALNALLAQSEPETDRIARLYAQMKTCYKELRMIAKPVWQQWLEAIVVAGLAAFVIRTFIFGIYHVPTGSAEPNILVGDRLWGNKMVYFFSKPQRGDLVIFNNPEFVYSDNSFLKLWQQYAGIPLFGVLPSGPDNWVKRVIAVPGDRIEGRVENGRTVIYRNGEKLDEPYVNPYPLLVLNKTMGFFSAKSFPGNLLPSFLQKRIRQVRYAYDPSKPLAEQPFYYMQPEEVVRSYATGDPVVLNAFDPWYDDDMRRTVDVFGPFTVPAGKYWVQGDSRRNSRDSRFWAFLDEEHLLGRASFVIFSIDSEEPLWLFALFKDPIGFLMHGIRWSRFLKPLWPIPNLREGLPEEVKEHLGEEA